MKNNRGARYYSYFVHSGFINYKSQFFAKIIAPGCASDMNASSLITSEISHSYRINNQLIVTKIPYGPIAADLGI